MIIISVYFSTFRSNQKAFNFIFNYKEVLLNRSEMLQMNNTLEMLKDIYPSWHFFCSRHQWWTIQDNAVLWNNRGHVWWPFTWGHTRIYSNRRTNVRILLKQMYKFYYIMHPIFVWYSFRDSNSPTLGGRQLSHSEANFPKSTALPLEFDFLPLKWCWIKNKKKLIIKMNK